MKAPEVELSDCKVCEICVEVCPSVFRLNQTGYIEVVIMDHYPEAEVIEAIKNCPCHCIHPGVD